MKTPGPHDPTPSLDEFLAAYDADDNEWWYLGSGHHQNLFDEAVERMRIAEARMTAVDWGQPRQEPEPEQWSCAEGWFGEPPRLGVETWPCGAAVTDVFHEIHVREAP